MGDLFEQKAQGWDSRPLPAQISAGVGQALLKRVALRTDMEVLDFGAGTGLLCSHVAPHVKRIYAADISAAMLERLAAKPELQGIVEVVCQDITETPFLQQVDLIVSAMAMHHVKDTNKLLHTFAQQLKPGGKVALADLDTEDGSFHPPNIEGVFHHGFDRDALQAALENHGFSEVAFTTALELQPDERRYSVFLVTATRN